MPMTTMLLARLSRPARRSLARRALLSAPSMRWRSDAAADDDADGVLPTHIKFRMPDLDFEQISGGSGGVTLAKWHAREGAAVTDGTHMCEIDTPDLVFVLDSGDEGFLARILVPAETKDVPPGQPLAIIVPTEADIAPFLDALQRHPKAIEGYVELAAPATPATTDAASTNDADSGGGAAVLRLLHKLHKDGHFVDEKILKVLKSLARKNDAQLLVTYKGSFDGEAFDHAFFVETAVELAEEALAHQDKSSN